MNEQLTASCLSSAKVQIATKEDFTTICLSVTRTGIVEAGDLASSLCEDRTNTKGGEGKKCTDFHLDGSCLDW